MYNNLLEYKMSTNVLGRQWDRFLLIREIEEYSGSMCPMLSIVLGLIRGKDMACNNNL